METQGYTVRDSKPEATKAELLLRERAKNIFESLLQCHNIMDELVGLIPQDMAGPKVVVSGRLEELESQLSGLESISAELNERMKKLLNKI